MEIPIVQTPTFWLLLSEDPHRGSIQNYQVSVRLLLVCQCSRFVFQPDAYCHAKGMTLCVCVCVPWWSSSLLRLFLPESEAFLQWGALAIDPKEAGGSWRATGSCLTVALRCQVVSGAVSDAVAQRLFRGSLQPQLLQM